MAEEEAVKEAEKFAPYLDPEEWDMAAVAKFISSGAKYAVTNKNGDGFVQIIANEEGHPAASEDFSLDVQTRPGFHKLFYEDQPLSQRYEAILLAFDCMIYEQSVKNKNECEETLANVEKTLQRCKQELAPPASPLLSTSRMNGGIRGLFHSFAIKFLPTTDLWRNLCIIDGLECSVCADSKQNFSSPLPIIPSPILGKVNETKGDKGDNRTDNEKQGTKANYKGEKKMAFKNRKPRVK
ncbi:hypothetical protein E0Z10_g837 [Xylaria hypoxylon]|uniref:Uncharacterized protein n=1 Tax=Xylaria hypoxylon TaxID=37992 RepID=A0A4Z0YU71_9PEZI|nr:hypothetical protein E0Z10_g837 [Xylaria hypoxylon]